MRLVSASDEVIIWDCSLNQELVFNPFNKPVSQVLWACSNQALCLLSEDGSSVGLSWIEKDLTNDIPMSSTATTCISLSSKSRHLLMGQSNGVINAYDFKSQSYTFTLNSHKSSKVNSVVFANNDSRVIASYSDGEMIPFNRYSGSAYSSFHVPSKSPSLWISNNYVSDKIISTCHSDGILAVWDISSMQLSQIYHEHIGPVSRAQFSPINKSLLVSCGLDNHVIFYDIDSQKVINNIDCESAVTCLNIAPQGDILAIGKFDGSITLYDLRKLDEYLAVKRVAHTSSVKEVSFELDIENYSLVATDKENCRRASSKHRDSASTCYSLQSSRVPFSEIYSNRDSIDLEFSVCSEDFSNTFSDEHLENLTLFDNADQYRQSIGPSLCRKSLAVRRFPDKQHLYSPQRNLLKSPAGEKSMTPEKVRASFKLDDSKDTLINSPSRFNPFCKSTQLNNIPEETHTNCNETTVPSNTERSTVGQSKINQLVQAEMKSYSVEFNRILNCEMDKLKSDLMSEVIKQLIISETGILSKVHELLDDREKLLAEIRRLRYENQKLKRI